MPWLPYLRAPGGAWTTLTRTREGLAWPSKIAAHQAALNLNPDLPHPNMGAIAATPDGHQYTLAPTDEDPATPRGKTPRTCPRTCTIHPHRPLAHLIGHDTPGIRAASTLHRLGYLDLADITMAMHARILEEVRGLGTTALDRLQALAQGHTPPPPKLDLAHLAMLFRQLDSAVALHRRTATEPVQHMLYHLEHARSYLHEIRAEEPHR